MVIAAAGGFAIGFLQMVTNGFRILTLVEVEVAALKASVAEATEEADTLKTKLRSDREVTDRSPANDPLVDVTDGNLAEDGQRSTNVSDPFAR